jgi:predicted DNA-binding transcriptional regulator AlpA
LLDRQTPPGATGAQNMTEPRLNRIYRLRDLPEFVGLRRTQINELIQLGQFPSPVPLSDSGRAIGFLETDLIAWQNARIAARNAHIAERDAKVA